MQSASQTFHWTVLPDQLAPVLWSPGDQSNVGGDSVSLPVQAFDPDNNSLTYTVTGLPSELILDANSGTISGRIDGSAVSATPYAVTLKASNWQASASQTFNWSMAAVGVSNPYDQGNVIGDIVNLPIAASDAASLSLTYTAANLPPGLSINAATGVISGTVASTADTSNPYNVSVTATTPNSNTQTFDWYVAALERLLALSLR